MAYATRLLTITALIMFCLIFFDLTSANSVKLKMEVEDPPKCDGQSRTNPFPGQCGQRKENFKRRKRDGLHSGDIVGGHGVLRGDFPWYVALDDCGATIVNDINLITAAHCFDKVNGVGQKVIAGSILPWKEVYGSTSGFMDSSEYCGIQIREIVEVELHPKFCSADDAKSKKCVNFQNDVAIITVDRPFLFDDFVQPACLPEKEWNINPGTELVVVGNGLTDYDMWTKTDSLQMVEVPVISLDTCKAWLKNFALTMEMLCAGYEKGGKDACIGDSGGPLFLPAEKTDATNGATTLVGVVSWGTRGCASPRTPGVYARMDSALPWIQSQVKIQTHKSTQIEQDAEEAGNSSVGILHDCGCLALVILETWLFQT